MTTTLVVDMDIDQSGDLCGWYSLGKCLLLMKYNSLFYHHKDPPTSSSQTFLPTLMGKNVRPVTFTVRCSTPTHDRETTQLDSEIKIEP